MTRKKYLSILILILTIFIFNCSGKSRTFTDDDAIVQSIKDRNMDSFKQLLKKYRINARNDKDYTLLMLASRWKRNDFVKYLLEQGAKVNLQDKEGNTALVFAIEFGRDDNVELLLDNGADINIKPKNKSLFAFACDNLYLKTLKRLVKLGVDYSYKDEQGRNGIMLIIYSHRPSEFIDYFVELGLDVNEKDRNGETPLLWVCKSHNPFEYLETLLKYGADPNITDKEGRTALDTLHEFTGDYFNLSDLLIEAGGKRAKDL